MTRGSMRRQRRWAWGPRAATISTDPRRCSLQFLESFRFIL
jgi:hypothetical protein